MQAVSEILHAISNSDDLWSIVFKKKPTIAVVVECNKDGRVAISVDVNRSMLFEFLFLHQFAFLFSQRGAPMTRPPRFFQRSASMGLVQVSRCRGSKINSFKNLPQ